MPSLEEHRKQNIGTPRTYEEHVEFEKQQKERARQADIQSRINHAQAQKLRLEAEANPLDRSQKNHREQYLEQQEHMKQVEEQKRAQSKENGTVG